MPSHTSKKNPDTVAREMELYCAAHPRGPAAVRRPVLLRRGNVWVALLGKSIHDGVAGFGPTIQAALRAFDVQYHNMLRPQAAA
jgi:hypothetical protein